MLFTAVPRTFILNHSVYVDYIQESGNCDGVASTGTKLRAGQSMDRFKAVG
jgi:hypothetical protein